MKGKAGRIGSFAVAGLLVMAMFAMAMPAMAEQNLVVTDYNKWYLTNGGIWVSYSNGELLKWIGDGPRFDMMNPQYKKLKWIGSIPAVTIADNYGTWWSWGECVSLVKTLSWSNVVTSDWIRGDNVMASNVAPGTAIATFNSNKKYEPGHAAIFRGYTYNSYGQRTGILVWDQNYLPPPPNGGVIARHSISSKGTSYLTDATNANNYYAVRVP